MRHRGASAVLATLLVLASCTSQTQDPSLDADGSHDLPTPSGLGADQQLDCEREGYPCSWSDADPAAAIRTDELLAFSALLLAQGETSAELARRLETAAGVVEVIFDSITVWFRVEGAVPVIVYVDPTDGGLIEGSVPPLDVTEFGARSPRANWQVAQPRFTGCAATTDERTDGQPGTVGEAGQHGDEVTRGADILSLHTERGGPELTDGGLIRVEGQPGDGAIDTLKLGARLSGVGEEGPHAYQIEILLGDEGLRLREYEWSPADVEGAFEAEIEVFASDLPDEPFDLEIRTPLPDAGGAMSLGGIGVSKVAVRVGR
jgi:hypothetical protein